MKSTQSAKPSYLGSLNAIVNGERRGFQFLDAWAKVSPDPDVALMLKTVALREGEHAASFEKRICELGYGLIEKDDPKFEETMKLAGSDASDLEKFEKLGYDKTPAEGGTDGLLQLLADKSIDPQTGALLGRFIAEERDSGRILREAYQCAKSCQDDSGSNAATLAQICEQLQKLTEAVSELQMADKKSKVRAVKS
jgi:rubrerythrin